MENQTKSITLDSENFTVKVMDEDIDDIMDAAMYGCTYWCKGVTVMGPYLGENASDQISRGGKLLFMPIADKTVELDKEKFIEGLHKWVLLKGNDIDTIVEGCVDTGYIDTGAIDIDDADSILQLALFGEIIYG